MMLVDESRRFRHTSGRVNLDDPDMYRRVKAAAAAEGLPIKVFVERVIRMYFEQEDRGCPIRMTK